MTILNYVKYLWRVTSGFHRTAILRTILGVVRVCVVLLFIWLSKAAIDCATSPDVVDRQRLILLFVVMIFCLPLDAILSQWARYLESRATMKMNNALNRRLFNVLMAMPLVHGQQGFHSGDMLNRLTLDVRTISNFALTQVPSMFVMAVQLIGAFIFLAWLNPFLALTPIIIMPVCIFASKLYFRRNRELIASIRRGESDVQVSIQDGLIHRMVLKSLECVDELDHRLGLIQNKLNATNREQTRLSVISGAIVRLGFIAGYLTAFGWSIFSLAAGVITYGTMTAFIQLVNRIQSPIAGIAGYIPAFIKTSVAIDRLKEVEELRGIGGSSGFGGIGRQRGESGATRVLEATGVIGRNRGKSGGNSNKVPLGVRVEGLTFRYSDAEREIFAGFSYDFRPGSRTMIVGPTGVGKSTLIKLLLGLLEPVEGSIELYDGDGRRLIVTEATLGHFVYVPQGNSLLHGTIRDNLRLAAPDAADDRLADVLHTAAADFVFELPQGLDTVCDETGAGLSEGQAQRIAIARALLRPGSVLLLDEFNSALDVATAQTLMKRLSERCTDNTIIIIAHHQTAVAPYCDDILELAGVKD